MSEIVNIFKVPELKRRILFTCAVLIVYRLGAHIPTPGIDAAVLGEVFSRAAGTLFGFFDLFAGGALRRASIFAPLALTGGSVLLMWMGEQISERGIGNGISLLIFAGIIVNLPGAIFNSYQLLTTGELKAYVLLFIVVVMVLVVAGGGV